MATQQKCDMEEETSVDSSHHTHFSVQQMVMQDWKQTECRVCFMREVSTGFKLRCKTENSDRHLWAHSTHSKCGMPGNQGSLSWKTRLCKEYVRRKSCGQRQLKENAEEIKRDKDKKEMNYSKKKWSKSSGANVQTG